MSGYRHTKSSTVGITISEMNTTPAEIKLYVLACAKSAHVLIQKLSYSLCELLSLITLPQTLRLFYLSLRSHAPQQQYIVHCMHYGITLWAYLSEPLVKDSHKCLSSMEKAIIPRAQVTSLDHTLPLHTCYREIYGNISHEENG